jgi:site-specific DNA-methyltransferase (cytosine-N4-specific)
MKMRRRRRNRLANRVRQITRKVQKRGARFKSPAKQQRSRLTKKAKATKVGPTESSYTLRGFAEEKAGSSLPYLTTPHGKIICDDSIRVLAELEDSSVDLFMTSPPFGLVRKKDYGNVEADEYVEWFKPFAKQMHRCLKDSGSLVIDIGGAWNKGYPTRNLYHFKLLISLCEDVGFHLAQDFYWWNPARLPTPAEWVTIRRVRVKDAVNTVWWVSKTPWPKASNRRVLQPYSPAMHTLLANGYTAKKRPSGHDISEKFSVNNGAAIPPNLIAIPNTESNSHYLRYCEERGLAPHPARFPGELPEFFVRMLTDIGDYVVDPFAGSSVTGEVCERLKRNWLCAEILPEYCEAARGRFSRAPDASSRQTGKPERPADDRNYYQVARPGVLWNGAAGEPLPSDGGRKRSLRKELKEAPLPESDMLA